MGPGSETGSRSPGGSYLEMGGVCLALVGLLTVASWILLEGPSLVIHTHQKGGLHMSNAPNDNLSQEAPQWMRDIFEELKDMFAELFPDADADKLNLEGI